MSTLKRSWDQMEDSDDEPTMGKRTLPVARLPENFASEPMDGMQYLFTVRRDARKLPNFTRVVNPFETISAKVEVRDAAPATISTRVALPSDEWRSVFLQRFINFRKNLLQATIGVALPTSTRRAKVMPDKKERDNWWAFINGRPECEWNPPKKPPKKPRQEKYGHARTMRGWDCSTDSISQYEVSYTDDVPAPAALVVNEYGEIAEEPASLKVDLEDELEKGDAAAESLPSPLATPQPETRYKNSDCDLERQKIQAQSGRAGRPQLPTPTLLKQMDSRYCTHLLMYFTHWINQHLTQLESPQPLPFAYARLSQNHARWMFALLSRVDEQLTSDELSNLRSLARACLALIKDLNKNRTSEDTLCSGTNWVGDAAEAPMDERACWIIVTTITDFWGQKDLWMDADSMLH